MPLLKELQRRNVIRVAAAYAVMSWLLIQVAETLATYHALPQRDPLSDTDKLCLESRLGRREQANQIAQAIDARIGGSVALVMAIVNCYNGAPFDLEAAPNFKRRIEESGFSWPPPSVIDFPAKDW